MVSQPKLGASANIYMGFLSRNLSSPLHSSYELQHRYQSPETGKTFFSNVSENIEGCISKQS